MTTTATRPRDVNTRTVETPDARRSRKRLSLDARALLIQLGVLVAFLVIWQVAASTGIVNQDFVSSPAQLVQSAIDLYSQQQVWSALGQSGLAMLIAFMIGTLLGVAGGFLLGMVPLLKDAYFGGILFFMSTPKSIFIPIFLLIFGIGPAAPVAYAAFATFFYVCVNVVGGVGLVQEKHLRVVTAYRGSWWQRLTDVVLPASAPGVFAGVWYGIKHSVLEVLIMELYISAAGLGSLIQLYSNRLQVDNVLVLVLTVVIVSVLLGSLWNRLESRLERWRPEKTMDDSLALS